MSVTLGRCTLVEDPYSIRWDGDVVSFEIEVRGVAQAGTAVDDMKAKVQQLRGLMDNDDEDVFPATFSEDSTLDGFYDRFRVSISDVPVMLTTGLCIAAISMRRVAGSAAALFENTATMVVRTNGHSLPATATLSAIGIPYTNIIEASNSTALSSALTSPTFANGTTLTTEDGIVRVGSFGRAGPERFRWTWAVPPASFYEASAKIEQSFGGTMYPLVGAQILPSSTSWRISNGLVRVAVTATGFTVAHYDAAGWDTAKAWTVGGTSATYLMSAIKAVRVLKNTPQQVVVRCTVIVDSGAVVATLDISLRRGCRFAEFYLFSLLADTWYIDNNEAGTAITGGIRATSTDVSGNRYVVASPNAQTNVLTTGRLKLTSTATSFSFMVGSDVGAAGIHATQVDTYFNAIGDDQRVIAR